MINCGRARISGTENVWDFWLGGLTEGGSNSVVECQLPKLDVAGSTPVSRSNFQQLRDTHRFLVTPFTPLSPVRLKLVVSRAATFETQQLRVCSPRPAFAPDLNWCTHPYLRRYRDLVGRKR